MADKSSLILGAGNSLSNQSINAANTVSNKTLDLANSLAVLDTHLKNIVYTTVEEQVCSWEWSFLTGDFWSCSIVKKIYKAQSWLDKEAGLQAQVTAARGALNQPISTLKSINNTLLAAAITEVNRQTSILNGALTHHEQLIDTNPLKAAVANWRAATDDAMADYIRTSGIVIREFIRPNGDMVTPLNQWLNSQLPKVTGIPRGIVDLSCQGKNSYQQVVAELNKLTSTIAQIDPGMRAYLELKSELEETIKVTVDNQLKTVAEQIIGPENMAFMKSLKEEPTDASLKAAFTTSANKNLMLIPDIYTRARAEMYLQADGKFDALRFAPVFNAVVMAKLTLLDNAGQNELAKKITAYNNWKKNSGCYTGYCPFGTLDNALSWGWNTVSFPSGTLCEENNILFAAVKSIDGDHQWREYAPPYPRQGGFDLIKKVTDRNYGYGASDGVNKGFCYWKTDARAGVFRKLFKGPLVAGLEIPSYFNLPQVLSSDYPYSLVLPTYNGPGSTPNNFPDKCQTIKFLYQIGQTTGMWSGSQDYCDKNSTSGSSFSVSN